MVEVLKSGLLDTVQDIGRNGFQQFGVPISGVMDHVSAERANRILGNHRDAAVIECTASGPKLLFHQDTVICISGAFMSPKLNGYSLENDKAISIANGDVLSFGTLIYGFRAYIAVYGGFQTEIVMKSRSMYANITSQSRLLKGDCIPILDKEEAAFSSFSSLKLKNDHFDSILLSVYKGPEFNGLSVEQQRLLRHQEFTVSRDSNRMAYQLNERVENELESIITSLVLPGTVQLTPAGKLLILMRDAQTTGGYPRVFQLSESSINCLSQKAIGAKVKFVCRK